MSNWKSILGGLFAVLAILIVGGSTLEDPQAQPRGADQIIFAVATFLSVFVLHWLLWRFIVPATSTVPAQVTSFCHSQLRRGFFTGTIAFGYVEIALYCVNLSGYLPPADSRGHVGFLVMGLLLIGLGTAARLRDLIAALSASRERPPTNS